MRPWYVADFETTDKTYYAQHGNTRVWLYAVADSKGEIANFGDSIEKFFEWVSNNPNIIVYFHNLKFDGSFILNYLITHNYQYIDDLKSQGPKGYNTLIGEEGQYYSITVNLASKKQIIFYDSLKIIPLKVKEIAKAFKLPIEKEVIDYSNYEINYDTLKYVFNDVKIVAYALAFFKDNGFNRMTIGSTSYNDFKATINGFESYFPELPRDFIEQYRKAYRGGRSQVNPRYAGKILFNVRRYDINSMYPYAISRFPMPYGQPIPQSSPGIREFELYKVSIDFKLKRGHLPTLLKTGSMFNAGGDTYYIETDSIETIYISSVDLELLQRHYDIYYLEYIEIYGFNTSKYIFRSWVDKYYSLKSSATGGMRLVYKLLLNNLYGKFGSKCKGAKRIPKLDQDLALTFQLTEIADMPIYYLPVAIAVTSWCHKLIDDAILMTGYENFVYCDTDSVHTLGELKAEVIDPSELGKFKMEGVELCSKYIRQKCYCYSELVEDKESGKNKLVYNITCAGMSQGVKDYLIRMYNDKIFDKFTIGLKVDESSEGILDKELKLRPKQVPGGTVLMPVPFSLN